jgi:hypothetical protein
MSVYEMTCELPCLEELWEANDAAEFEAAVTRRGPDSWRRSASLRDCMDAFMADPWSGVDGFPLKNPTMHDLYICITGETALLPLSPWYRLLTQVWGW